MKVLAINGSPRRDGNTAILLRRVLTALQREGIDGELIQIGGLPLRGCRACYGCRSRKDGHCTVRDDPMNDILDQMFAADGLLLGSPTYFTDVTTEMKALIDRAGFTARANGDLLRRKVGAAVVSVRRAGAMHAFDTINHFFLINQVVVPGSSYWNIGIGNRPGEVEDDPEGLATMDVLGANMAWLMKRLCGPNPSAPIDNITPV